MVAFVSCSCSNTTNVSNMMKVEIDHLHPIICTVAKFYSDSS
jgi:hypothetical protein